MNRIRLSAYDLESVIKTFKEIFPEGDSLWIFGSRVYPEKRGGDIDLYVETNIKDVSEAVNTKYKYLSLLQDRIGEQKIDLVLKRNKDKVLAIHEVARAEGIRLV